MNVIRDGKLDRIHQDKILVGDLVSVEGGMEIPADALVLEGN